MEVWKEIKNSGGYQVSNMGKIKNPKGRFLTGSDKDGYVRVFVNYKKVRLHRVVAEYFIKNPENKLEVNHKDGNKKNNYASNLEWSTRKENMGHAVKKGLHSVGFGEKNPASILTKNQVDYIRAVYKARDKEFGQSALGRKFGVSNSCVWRIVHGNNWRNN